MTDPGATEAHTPETAGMLAVQPPVFIMSWDVPSPQALSERDRPAAWVWGGLAAGMLSGLRARSRQILDALGRRTAQGARSLGAGAAIWGRCISDVATNGRNAARRGAVRLRSGWRGAMRRVGGLGAWTGRAADALARRTAQGGREWGEAAAAWRRRASGVTANGLQAARRGAARLRSEWRGPMWRVGAMRAWTGRAADALGRRTAQGAHEWGEAAAAWRRRASGVATNGLQAARRGAGRLGSGWRASTRRVAGLTTQVAAIRLPRPRHGPERLAELRSRLSLQVARLGQTLGAASARRGLATAAAALALAFGAGFLTARWDSPNGRSPAPGGGVDGPRAGVVRTAVVLASAPTDAATIAKRPDPMVVAQRLDGSIYQGTVDGGDGSLHKASATSSPALDRAHSPRAHSKPSRKSRSSHTCQDADTPAERMVCADPNLESADRALKRAYDRAIAAGVPAAELQADHHDWLEMREDAARSSRREVAALYDSRIGVVNLMADPPH